FGSTVFVAEAAPPSDGAGAGVDTLGVELTVESLPPHAARPPARATAAAAAATAPNRPRGAVLFIGSSPVPVSVRPGVRSRVPYAPSSRRGLRIPVLDGDGAVLEVLRHTAGHRVLIARREAQGS